MNMLRKTLELIANKILGPRTKFNKSDAVQHISGGPLMIVTGIQPVKDKCVQVHCRWFDSDSQSMKTQAFPEPELRLFDWYNPS
jgi:uncharacterized protein YodC (DUF2158 family)